ncbi:MAG: LemA family protein [Candidatus Omnitrophica bacterium]|nr:LemA family protein [Candidatus Omnitrophota bacterium]
MGIVLLVILIFGLVGLAGLFIGIYNGLVRLRHNIDKAWANIDVLLKQRHDELPKLMETCKGYMTHERGLIEKVLEARAAYFNAGSIDAKTVATNEMSKMLKSLFALAENYPDLKANQNFLQLQGRISSLENEIADRREFFNESVTLYNIKIQQFPDVLLARQLGYTPHHLLEVAEEDKRDVDIKF